MSQLMAWRGRAPRHSVRQLLLTTVLALAAGGAFGSGALAASPARGPADGGPSHPSGGGGTGPSGGGGTGGGTGRSVKAGPLGQKAMWIWYVADSDNGKLGSIVATARHYGIGTVIIKSGDGTHYWSQFTRSLVKSLHAAGLGVCGWQYVYGIKPALEARVGAKAAQAGADCLLVDAESQYEGKYVQAQKYIRDLRVVVGSNYRVGLASFPYVDFHPSFPYSVFLGPGGAQFNVPQMYWQDIGDSPGTVYGHTFSDNAVYERSILPLGQAYNGPPTGQIKRFRQLRWVYRAGGISWWDWQSASAKTWQALRAPIQKLDSTPQTQLPKLSEAGQGGISAGDLVVWAQEHLVSAGYRLTVDGSYATQTDTAVIHFQAGHHLPKTGKVNPKTWAALLRYPPAKVTWKSSGATVARAGGGTLPPPASARLPAVAYEIPPDLGAGRPGPVNP